MQRVYSACFIFVLMLFVGIFSLTSTNKCVDDITKSVDELHMFAQNGDERINESLNELSDKWDRYEKKLAMYTEHGELEPIGMSIAVLKEYYSIGSYDQFQIACEQMKMSLEHLKNNQRPLLKNIL